MLAARSCGGAAADPESEVLIGLNVAASATLRWHMYFFRDHQALPEFQAGRAGACALPDGVCPSGRSSDGVDIGGNRLQGPGATSIKKSRVGLCPAIREAAAHRDCLPWCGSHRRLGRLMELTAVEQDSPRREALGIGGTF